MRTAVLLTALLLALDTEARRPEQVAPAHADCNFVTSAKGPFSSTAPTDKLTATVQGAPCYTGRFRIVVQNAAGAVLYEYDEPFKRHTAVPCDHDEGILEAARRLVDEVAAEAFANTSADLPAFLPPHELYEDAYTTVVIRRPSAHGSWPREGSSRARRPEPSCSSRVARAGRPGAYSFGAPGCLR